MTGVIAILPTTPTVPLTSEAQLFSRAPRASTSDASLTMVSLGCTPGEGLPSNMSVAGVQSQMLVVDRWGDGSPRQFIAATPLSEVEQPIGTMVLDENVAGVASAQAGVYPGPSPTLIQIDMENIRGIYRASPATATNSFVVVGNGSDLGAQGPDHIKITRYFCPLLAVDTVLNTGKHAQCGAIIMYVTERTDFTGLKVQFKLTSAVEETGTNLATGYTPSDKNPGYVIYRRLSHPRIVGYNAEALDKCSNVAEPVSPVAVDGSSDVNNCVAPFNDPNSMHVLPQGHSPGFTYVFRQNGQAALSQANHILTSQDFAFAQNGRHFGEGSVYGFGPNVLRHMDPTKVSLGFPHNGNTLEDANGRCRDEWVDAITRMNQGAPVLSSGIARSGTAYCFQIADPNQAGGNGILGHGIYLAAPDMISWLSVFTMAETRRSNHDFYISDGARQHGPWDHLGTQTDNISAGVTETTPCTYYNAKEVLGYPRGSAQFNVTSPVSGQRTLPHTESISSLDDKHQPALAPTDRDWNNFQPGQQAGAQHEDFTASPYKTIGSHNLAHSARYLPGRDSFLFGLDMLGYDMTIGYSALCAAYHPPVEPYHAYEAWEVNRHQSCLSAWGDRDIPMTWDGEDLAGTAHLLSRRKGYKSGVGSHTVSTVDMISTDSSTLPESRKSGPELPESAINRTFGWSFVWQLSAMGIGTNEYRNVMQGNTITPIAGSVHNPLILFANAVDYWNPLSGVLTPTYTPNSGNTAFHDVEPRFGETDMITRLGGQPTYGSESGRVNDSGPDEAEYGVSLDFHNTYVSWATDAISTFLSTSGDTVNANKLRPVLRGFFWNLVANDAAPRKGALMGISKNPVSAIGVRGVGDMTGTRWTGETRPAGVPEGPHRGNDGPTENDYRAGRMWWIQEREEPSGSETVYYGHDQVNNTMALLMTLRYSSTMEKQEAISLYNQVLGRPASDSASEMRDNLTSLASIPYRFGAGTSIRVQPLVAEILRLVN